MYFTGLFGGSASFNDTIIDVYGATDAFIAAYTPEGENNWTRSLGASSSDYGTDLVIDNYGNIIMSGVFDDTLFAEGTELLSYGGMDGFLASFTPSGDLNWVRNFGGGSSDGCSGIDVDSENNIYAVGIFNDTCTFDSFELISEGYDDSYLAKFNDMGVCLWTKHIGNSNACLIKKVSVDNNNDIYAGGLFTYHVDIEDTTLYNYDITDLLLFKTNSDGDLLWADVIEGENMDQLNELQAVGDCLYFGGKYKEQIFLNDISYLTPSMGVMNGFLCKTYLDGSTDVSVVEENISVKVWPNPTKQTISLSGDQQIESLVISDLTGSVVRSFFLHSSSPKVNVSMLSPGTYILTIQSGKKFFRKKIVKL